MASRTKWLISIRNRLSRPQGLARISGAELVPCPRAGTDWARQSVVACLATISTCLSAPRLISVTSFCGTKIVLSIPLAAKARVIDQVLALGSPLPSFRSSFLFPSPLDLLPRRLDVVCRGEIVSEKDQESGAIRVRPAFDLVVIGYKASESHQFIIISHAIQPPE